MLPSTSAKALRVITELQERELLALTREVCRLRGVKLEELCGGVQRRSATLARYELWWRIRNDPERYYSMLELSRIFAVKHDTVVKGIRAYARRLDPASAAERSRE